MANRAEPPKLILIFQRLGLDSREMKNNFSKDCSTVYVGYN